jgi:hypothetical protein
MLWPEARQYFALFGWRQVAHRINDFAQVSSHDS